MDRDEVQRRAAEGGRKWRASLTPAERDAHYQRSAETRQRNKALQDERAAQERERLALQEARRLQRAERARLTMPERQAKARLKLQERRAAAILERRTALFWSYVDVASSDECWQWLGSIHGGYGSFSWVNGQQGAHGVMWLVTHGSIPGQHVIDHLCERKECVSPFHLEPVTDAENKAR